MSATKYLITLIVSFFCCIGFSQKEHLEIYILIDSINNNFDFNNNLENRENTFKFHIKKTIPQENYLYEFQNFINNKITKVKRLNSWIQVSNATLLLNNNSFITNIGDS